MRKLLSRIHLGLSWLAVGAIVAQFFLAGLGIFGVASFRAHATNGELIALGSLLLLALALAGRLGWVRIGFSALLVALTVVQALLPQGPPLVAALHPLNALLVLGVAVNLARLGMRSTGRQRVAGNAASTADLAMSGGQTR